MKKRGTTIILLIVLIVGLSLLLYPTFANWWNSMHQSRAVASYVEKVANIDEEQYAHLWEDALNYNKSLATRSNSYVLTEEQRETYNQVLDVGGLGIIGYVEVPSIGVTLPIYRGTDESVLQVFPSAAKARIVSFRDTADCRARSFSPISISLPSATYLCFACWTRYLPTR